MSEPMSKANNLSASLDRLHQQVDVQNRTILLYGEIEDDTLYKVWIGLCALRAADPEAEITVLIATQGGDVEVGLGIYDLLLHCGMPVKTIVTGYAHSMGIVILQAGDTRSAYPNSSLMAHWGHQGVEDTHPDNYKRKVKHQENLDDICDNIMVQRMKKKKKSMTMKKFKVLTALDWYMSPEEALKNGLLDQIEEM